MIKRFLGICLAALGLQAQQGRVYYVTDVSELAAQSGVGVNKTVLVGGYAAEGDGGGGVWYWSASGTTNLGTVIEGSSGYWHRQIGPEIDVRWFGAVGDNITDDTAAIQDAVNIATQTGKPLRLVQGHTNLITTSITVTNDCLILGSGATWHTQIAANYAIRALGSKGSESALIETAWRGNTNIVSSLSVSVGDIIKIESDLVFRNSSDSRLSGELARVLSIDGTTIALTEALKDTYYVADNATAAVITAFNLQVEDLNIYGDNAASQKGVYLVMLDSPKFIRGTYSTMHACFNVSDCWAPEWHQVNTQDAYNGNDGYGIAIGDATMHSRVFGGVHTGHRHAIQHGGSAAGGVVWDSRVIKAVGATRRGGNGAPFDAHDSVGSVFWEDCTAYPNSSEPGFSAHANIQEIRNCRVIGGYAGVYTAAARTTAGEQFLIDGLEVRPYSVLEQDIAPGDVDTANDRITFSTRPSDGQRFRLSTTDTMPGGMTADKWYFIKAISTYVGEVYTDGLLASKLDITTQGAGTHTSTHASTSYGVYLNGCAWDIVTLRNISGYSIRSGVLGFNGMTATNLVMSDIRAFESPLLNINTGAAAVLPQELMFESCLASYPEQVRFPNDSVAAEFDGKRIRFKDCRWINTPAAIYALTSDPLELIIDGCEFRNTYEAPIWLKADSTALRVINSIFEKGTSSRTFCVGESFDSVQLINSRVNGWTTFLDTAENYGNILAIGNYFSGSLGNSAASLPFWRQSVSSSPLASDIMFPARGSAPTPGADQAVIYSELDGAIAGFKLKNDTEEAGWLLSSTNSASTDNAIARWDSTVRRYLQNSAVTIDDNGILGLVSAAAPTTDAAGEVALDNNFYGSSLGAVQYFDGTTNCIVVGYAITDTPAAGQVPTWNDTYKRFTIETPGGGGDMLAAVFDANADDDIDLAAGGTGASLADPNADRILFWDDSDGAVQWLVVGTGLSIDGASDTLSASAGSGTMSTVKEATSQVGDADIVTLDFGAGFDLSEDPGTEINIDLDITELSFSSANLATALTDETGTGSGSPKVVFSVNPYIIGPSIDQTANVSYLNVTNTTTLQALTGSRAVFTTAGKDLTSAGASADLAASLSDETGTGVAVFGTSPTFTTGLSSPVVQSTAGDVADAGVIRLGNAEVIAWEASPADTDITLTVDSSEVMQASGTFNAAVLTEGGNAVPNVTDNLGVFGGTTSAQLYGELSDETGSGSGSPLAVFNVNPFFIGASFDQTVNTSYLNVTNTTTLQGLTGSRAVFTTAGKDLTSSGASADLAGSLSDETGSGVAVFGTGPTINGATLTGAIDGGGATSLEIPNSDNPTVDAAGEISWDTDGWLRAYDGANQVAIGRKIVTIQSTVILPNDLADSERDALWIWSNESGMNFIVTGWKGWSDTDDTTLNIEEIDGDGQNNSTVDAVEIATNGTGLYSGTDGDGITAGTIENGHIIVLDFDDTDTPGQVKMTIYGYFDANVN